MFDSNQFFGAQAGFYPLTIDQSLRFNDDDSAYLSRTPASAGNRKTWTWSGWVKRGNLGGDQHILRINAPSETNFRFNSTNVLNFVTESKIVLQTTAVYRDVSAWYHIVIAVDTTQATASNRTKLYVNGEQVTVFNTESYPSLNYDTSVSTTNEHFLGQSGSSTTYLDGYLAEVHFTDGTAYDADAFGEFKEGVWVAKAPSVTYGTNGFYLDFANSADIGNDVSGEGNDWTPNNFTASDVVLDSPTDNFVTWNPLDKDTGITLSDGNLQATAADGLSHSNVRSTIALPSSGKFYAEFEYTTTIVGSTAIALGLADETVTLTGIPVGQSGFWGIYSSTSTSFFTAGSSTTAVSTGSVGDILQIAYDADAQKMWYGLNNSWYDSSGGTTGNPATGANPTASSVPNGLRFIGDVVNASTQNLIANFGQQDFTYTPPSGYLPLSTANLPDPAIDPAQGSSPQDYFAPAIYTGNGSTQSIDVGFATDWTWIKARSQAYSSQVYDSVRGATLSMQSNSSGAEATVSTGLTTFDSVGFDIGSNNGVNQSGETYVAWNWKANGSGVSNTDGTITSTVSANTESGFSIVSYTGNGSTDQTVGHGLGVAPDMLIVKRRNSTSNWVVWHRSVCSGNGKYLYLDLTSALGGPAFTPVWDTGNTTTQSSTTVFDISANTLVNANTGTYIAYCFSEVENFSKFGSYTGNGSADGPFVYTGFRPAFVMYKNTSIAADWDIHDATRNAFNTTKNRLWANLSSAEVVSTYDIDFLSNGFKVRNTNPDTNTNGNTIIYMAFAENPFKYSLAR